MSDNHWIVTNRSVINDKVIEDDDIARPTFRIARFSPPAENSTDDSFRAAVQFVPDTNHSDSFRDLQKDQDPEELGGTKQLFLALYQSMLSASPKKGDVLVFLHGFNYEWIDSLRHLQKLHELYVEPPSSSVKNIVYFSWPSYGELTRYRSDQENARVSGQLLGRLFAKLSFFHQDFFDPAKRRALPEFCGNRIHLAAHSMGNQVLETFFAGMNANTTIRKNLFGEILLLNADADWDALESDYPLYSMPEYADRIHVYNHSSDDALLISQNSKNDKKRLGRQGPRDIDLIPPRTIVVDATHAPMDINPSKDDTFFGRIKSILSPNLYVRERAFDHWGYLYRQSVIADVTDVLKGSPVNKISTRDQKGNSGHLFSIKEL